MRGFDEREPDPLRLHAGFAVIVLVGWHVAHLLAPRAFPTLPAVGAALYEQVASGALAGALGKAFGAIVVGYLAAVLVGVPVGLAMGASDAVEGLLEPYLDALYVTPIAALVPALILWFGTGTEVRIVVVFLFSLFPIAINTLEGAKTVPADLVDVARSFGADRRFLLRDVVLPHEASYVLAGLRLGIGRAVKGLVVAELLVSVTGFGAIITQWSVASRVEGVYSVVLVLMGLGVAATWLLGRVERRLFPWRRRQRS